MLQQTDLVINSSVHASAGAFVVCWTPGLVTLLLDGLLGRDSHANVYEKFCLVIAECNSLVNPIIYTLRDQEMYRTFRWILCCLCGRKEQREGSPLEFTPSPITTQVRVHTAGGDPSVELLPGCLIMGESRVLFCSVNRKLLTLSRSQKSMQPNQMIMKTAGVSGGRESCRPDPGTSAHSAEK